MNDVSCVAMEKCNIYVMMYHVCFEKLLSIYLFICFPSFKVDICCCMVEEY